MLCEHKSNQGGEAGFTEWRLIPLQLAFSKHQCRMLVKDVVVLCLLMNAFQVFRETNTDAADKLHKRYETGAVKSDARLADREGTTQSPPR